MVCSFGRRMEVNWTRCLAEEVVRSYRIIDVFQIHETAGFAGGQHVRYKCKREIKKT